MTDISELIDLDRYPLDSADLIARTTAQLNDDGCAVLKGLVRPEQIASLVAEAEASAPFCHRKFNRTNVYFTKDDPTLPETHSLRRFYDRSNSFVPPTISDRTAFCTRSTNSPPSPPSSSRR